MRKKVGLSLLELTITIALSSLLLVGTSIAIKSQIASFQETRNYMIAVNLAKRQMAIMNKAAFPAVAAEASVTGDAAFPDYYVTQTVTSVAVSGSNNIRQITVRVYRSAAISGPLLIRLDTYRTDLVNFGNGS